MAWMTLVGAGCAYAGENSLATAEMGCGFKGTASLSLADTLSSTIDRSPRLRVAQEDVAKAEASVTAARSSLLPSLGLSMQGERFTPDSPTSPITIGNTVVGGTSEAKTLFGSVDLNWQLFSGGGNLARFRASRADMAAAREGKTQEWNDDVEGALASYIDVALAQLQVEMQRAVVNLHDAVADRAEAQFRQGLGTALKVAQAQSDVLQSTQALYQACREWAEASATLAKAMNQHLSVQQLYIVERAPATPISSVPFDMGVAIEQDPAVRAAQENVRAAEQRVRQARASFGPTLTLSGRRDYLGRDAESWSSAGHIEPNSYRIGLQLQQPLFPVMSQHAALRTAQSDLRRTRASAEQAVADAELRFHRASASLAEATATKAAAGELLKRSQQFHQLTESLFAQGRVSRDDVQQAEISVVEARTALDQAEARRIRAEWAISRVSDPAHFAAKLAAQFNLESVDLR